MLDSIWPRGVLGWFWLAMAAAPTAAHAQDRVPVPVEETELELEPRSVDAAFRVVWPGKEKAPVPGIRVALGFASKSQSSPRFIEEAVIVHATSDAEGLVTAQLPLGPEWEGIDDAVVWARSEEAGLVLNATSYFVGKPPKKVRQLSIYRGVTTFGRVHDAAGAPAAEVTVRLGLLREGAVESTTTTVTDSQGRFALSTRKKGMQGRLAARDARRGMAVGEVPAAGEWASLVLEPGSSMRGRLADPDGLPLGRMYLLGVPAGSREVPAKLDAALAELTQGAQTFRRQISEDGTFDVRGLNSGAYDFYASWGEPSLRGELDHASLFPVAQRVEINAETDVGDFVAPAYRLRVELRDPQGALLEPRLDSRGRPIEHWSQWLWLWDPSARNELPVYPIRTDASGCLFRFAGPGHFALGWVEPGSSLVEQSVAIQSGRYFQSVELTIEAGRVDVDLSVRVVAPDGTPYAGMPGVSVLSAQSRLPVVHQISEVGPIDGGYRDGVWSARVPVGSYLVQAEATDDRLRGGFAGCTSGVPLPDPWPRNKFFRGEAQVEVRSGERSELVLSLQPAGHIDFVLADGDSPALAAADAWPSWPSPELFDVLLLSPTGERVARVETVTEGGGSFPSSVVFPGVPARGVTALPTGRWRLVVRKGDVDALDRYVDIRAGEVTQVVW